MVLAGIRLSWWVLLVLAAAIATLIAVTIPWQQGTVAVPLPQAERQGERGRAPANELPAAPPESIAFGYEWVPSPYRHPRAQPADTLVIHTTAGSLASTIKEFQQSSRQVSAHYVVGRDARIVQMVGEQDVAYHAGILAPGAVSRFVGTRPNEYTIGIEIEHASAMRWEEEMPAAQKEAVFKLAREIVERNNIPANRQHIVGHHEISPGRKSDPGPGFPWSELIEHLG